GEGKLCSTLLKDTQDRISFRTKL
ncbi:unnamed protein product, partial [Allacma fusca]